MKYSIFLFRILLVSGIVLHSLLSIRFFETRMFFDWFSLMFLVYAFSWIFGNFISKREYGVRHFGFVVFITVLGIVFLLLAFSPFYLSIFGLEPMWSNFLLTVFGANFLLFCFLGGMVFLTVGVCGFGRRSCKGDKSNFSVIAVVAIPSVFFLLFLLLVFIWVLTNLTVGL